jgi:hypothetical protein
MKIAEGGCLCSTIRYRVAGLPRGSGLCHCNTCRRASAAPSVAWITFDRSRFEVVAGELTSFRSSPAVERTFCNRCGTPITYANDAEPDSIDVTTASLDDPLLYPPTKEIWLEHRLAWESTNPALSHHLQGGSSPAPDADAGAATYVLRLTASHGRRSLSCTSRPAP